MKKVLCFCLVLLSVLVMVSCVKEQIDEDKLRDNAIFDTSASIGGYAIVNANSDIQLSNISDEKSYIVTYNAIGNNKGLNGGNTKDSGPIKGKNGLVSMDSGTSDFTGYIISAADKEYKGKGSNLGISVNDVELRVKELPSSASESITGIDFYSDKNKVYPVKSGDNNGWLYANQVYFDLTKDTGINRNELYMVRATSGSFRQFGNDQYGISGNDFLNLDSPKGKFTAPATTNYIHSLHLVAGMPTPASQNVAQNGQSYLILKSPLHFSSTNNTISLNNTVNVFYISQSETKNFDSSKEYVIDFTFAEGITTIEGKSVSDKPQRFNFSSSGRAEATYYTNDDKNGKKRFEPVILGSTDTTTTIYLGKIEDKPFVFSQYFIIDSTIPNKKYNTAWGTATIRPIDTTPSTGSERHVTKVDLSTVTEQNPLELTLTVADCKKGSMICCPVIFNDPINNSSPKKTVKVEFFDSEDNAVAFNEIDNNMTLFFMINGGQRTSKNSNGFRPSDTSVKSLTYKMTGSKAEKIESMMIGANDTFTELVKKVKVTISLDAPQD